MQSPDMKVLVVMTSVPEALGNVNELAAFRFPVNNCACPPEPDIAMSKVDVALGIVIVKAFPFVTCQSRAFFWVATSANEMPNEIMPPTEFHRLSWFALLIYNAPVIVALAIVVLPSVLSPVTVSAVEDTAPAPDTEKFVELFT